MADLTQARLLLVDDQPANLQVLRDSLEDEGYEISIATSGRTALRVAEARRPDLILLDVMMPEMDGLETCRRLKQDPETREIPVIFVTAQDGVEHVIQAVAKTRGLRPKFAAPKSARLDFAIALRNEPGAFVLRIETLSGDLWRRLQSRLGDLAAEAAERRHGKQHPPEHPKP